MPPTDSYCHRIAHFGRESTKGEASWILFGMPDTGEQFVIRSFNPYQADELEDAVDILSVTASVCTLVLTF